jgi:hypothetical protein
MLKLCVIRTELTLFRHLGRPSNVYAGGGADTHPARRPPMEPPRKAQRRIFVLILKYFCNIMASAVLA